MGMKEVIEGTIADTVNERLKKVKDDISKELDDIINRLEIRSRTDPDEDIRGTCWTQGHTVASVKGIVLRKIDEAMVTRADPVRKDPRKNGGAGWKTT